MAQPLSNISQLSGTASPQGGAPPVMWTLVYSPNNYRYNPLINPSEIVLINQLNANDLGHHLAPFGRETWRPGDLVVKGNQALVEQAEHVRLSSLLAGHVQALFFSLGNNMVWPLMTINGCISPGWWFGTFSIFPYIGNNHPNWWTHIFQRGGPTTNQSHFHGIYITMGSKKWFNDSMGYSMGICFQDHPRVPQKVPTDLGDVPTIYNGLQLDGAPLWVVEYFSVGGSTCLYWYHTNELVCISYIVKMVQQQHILLIPCCSSTILYPVTMWKDPPSSSLRYWDMMGNSQRNMGISYNGSPAIRGLESWPKEWKSHLF